MDPLSPCFGAGREAALGRLLLFRLNVIPGVDVGVTVPANAAENLAAVVS